MSSSASPSPYDEETMERLVREVQPKLAAAVEVTTAIA